MIAALDGYPELRPELTLRRDRAQPQRLYKGNRPEPDVGQPYLGPRRHEKHRMLDAVDERVAVGHFRSYQCDPKSQFGK